MKKQNNNISDFEQKNVKVHRNVASKKMKVGVMWSVLFVLAVIGVLSVIGAVLSIKPKTEAENKNLVTYVSMPLEIENGVITKYNGTTDGTAVLNIPATYDVVDGKFVAGDTYKITGIGENVFKDVNFALLTVNLDNITRIGDSAFENATRVAFVGGEGYTIGKNAFKNAQIALEEVKVLPNGEEPAVDVDAFSGTTFLKSLKSPNSLSAEEVASTPEFTTTAVRGIIKFASGSLKQASSVKLSGFSGKVIFADNCAEDSTSLGAVTLNSKLSVEIGSHAFANTQNGNFAISGNANFRQIGSFAFLRSKIQSLNLSTSSLKTISQGMFSQCGSLASITLPSGVTSIGTGAFVECSGLTSITIPEGVTSIGNGAFGSCIGLTSITIPSRVTTIGASVFQNCSRLTSITIEGTTTPTLGSKAFDNTNNCDINVRGAVLVAAETATNWSTYKDRLVCPYLVVQYKSGSNTLVGEIEVGATIDSSTLTSTMVDGGTISSPKTNVLKVYIPRCVTGINTAALSGYSGLSSIVVDAGNQSYDSRNNCNAIIATSSNILGLGCKNTVIPNTVVAVAPNAFIGCTGLTSITIPNSVTAIGSFAFNGCVGLNRITIEGTTTPTLGSKAFDNTNNCDINVRGAVLVAAETDANWSTYKDRLVCPYLVAQYKSGSNTLVGEIEVGTTITSTTLTSTMVGGGTVSSPQTNVLKVYIPKSVTTIDRGAFMLYEALELIKIPNGVALICMQAFDSCTKLTSIVIPSSVTTIESSAFVRCSGLNSITIEGTTVPSIGASAFDNTNNCDINVSSAQFVMSAFSNAGWSNYLNRLVYPNLVVQYKSGSNTLVGEIEVGTTITSTTLTSTMVGGGTISSPKTNILKAYIPKGVTTIGTLSGNGSNNYGFNGCTSLTLVSIPNSVTTIGMSAFLGCTSLASVTIPSSVTRISYGAFMNCTALGSINVNCTTIPTIESTTFNNTNNCDINVSSAQFVMSAFSNASWSNYLNRLVYPNLVVQYKSGSDTLVGEIKVGTTITSSTLTSTMVVGGNISAKSDVLKAYIPKGVTTIGDRAFKDCSGLTSITIPSSVTTIGDYAFQSCTGFTSITIPSSVTSIGKTAFNYCRSLTSITIPNSTIGEDAFAACYSLTSVTIGSGVTTIGNSVFNGCDNLTSIVVESGNTKYDSRNNCNAIIEKSTNKLIGGCQNTVIPNSVTSIGEEAFVNNKSLTSITIPNSVTSIGEGAFSCCGFLTSITIGSGVTTIGYMAFEACAGLTSITIPNSVTTIGDCAFQDCSSLTSITINATTPPTLGSRAFYNTNKCPIYVPSAKVSTYKAASGWSSYTSRIYAK